MSKQIAEDNLYSRGKYKLERDKRRDRSLASPFLQITWYDKATRHYKRVSTGKTDERQAAIELDKHYLKHELGLAVCHTCGKANDTNAASESGATYNLSDAITDYLIARQDAPSYDAIQHRINHVLDYLEEIGQTEITPAAINEDWISKFRKRLLAKPIISAQGKARPRALSTAENSVLQLAAVINKAHKDKRIPAPANFAPLKTTTVNQSPQYRATIKTLGQMFRYAMVTGEFEEEQKSEAMVLRLRKSRAALHRYLQLAVATWARPDALYDFSTLPTRRQWYPSERVIVLNPKGRVQTKKHRPSILVGEKVAKLFKGTSDFYIGVQSIKKNFAAMAKALELPADGESGTKLIRRSVSTIARKKLGEDAWVQGSRMLGHTSTSTSDIYALSEPGQLGKVLAVTNEIIEEICALAPTAYEPSFDRCTRNAPELKIVEG